MTVISTTTLLTHDTIDGASPLSEAAVAAVHSFCDRAEDGDKDRPLVLRLSGAPAPGRSGRTSLRLVNRWEGALRRLERLRVATIAVVTGDCGGPALEALLTTDYRLAADGSRLVLSASGGVWPGMGLHRLANQVGSGRARRHLLLGEAITADRALQLGLVDELTADLPARLASAVEQVSALGGTALAVRRQLMLEAGATSFEEALGRHLAACDRQLKQAADEEDQSC
ncbi:enoyl-CoA-hydratase DpgB [Peterkaempfera sp. SMS 1(5)a]|uniref:enoyl-CoA-hydratase DpgB n=1 Tax=Peterkaempfera podocarpi TaxID=3232308 RepID=UPI0036712CF7